MMRIKGHGCYSFTLQKEEVVSELSCASVSRWGKMGEDGEICGKRGKDGGERLMVVTRT